MDVLLKEQLKKAYDADAVRRSANKNSRPDSKSRVRNQFMDLVLQEDKQTILEIGAGVGIDSEYFVSRGLKVLATDLSTAMVSECIKGGLEARVLDILIFIV